MFGKHPLQHTMEHSIQHHSAPPVVHHFVYTEHNGVHSPVQHISAPLHVAHAPVHPQAIKAQAEKPHPIKARLQSAYDRIRHMGHKSKDAVGTVKKSETAHKVAHGYKAVDEFQKGITNRPIL